MSANIIFVLALCLTAVTLGRSERVRYDNYRVYQVNASNREELALLKEMEDTSETLLFLDGVHLLNKAVNVVVPPQKESDFLLILQENDIDYKLVEKNLQDAVDKDYGQVATNETSSQWSAYQTLSFTYIWLQLMVRAYPGVASLIEAGKTYEKRSILGIKISYRNGNKQKPGIFLEAGIHAREWISPATATYVINELLTSEDKQVREIAENYEWYIIPHINPDGYVYTHTTDRMWRKTRQPYGACVGADPNRNWNVFWNTVGTSSNPCADTFAGSAPNSEIEIRTFSKYLTSLKNKLKLYISFHSYSQFILYPSGHTPDLPDNFRDFEQVFNATAKAISKRYQTVYTGGTIYNTIYPSAGTSVDYVYTELGIRMAVCYELRPSHTFIGNGWNLPAKEILPTAEETMDGIVAMVNEVKTLGYFD